MHLINGSKSDTHDLEQSESDVESGSGEEDDDVSFIDAGMHCLRRRGHDKQEPSDFV